MSQQLNIDLQKTAMVVIDLQKGIAAMQSEPYPAAKVIDNTSRLLAEARKKELPVFLVRVTPSKDFKDALRPVSETSFQMKGYDPAWSEYVPELNLQPTDFQITKHQWGAFYGTELDLQLRRREIGTIILCGIATNIGVESTARYAYELGYSQIFVQDAMAARSKEEHEFPLKYIFPRLGLIRDTKDVLEAIK